MTTHPILVGYDLDEITSHAEHTAAIDAMNHDELTCGGIREYVDAVRGARILGPDEAVINALGPREIARQLQITEDQFMDDVRHCWARAYTEEYLTQLTWEDRSDDKR